jgi:hypothetical protein
VTLEAARIDEVMAQALQSSEADLALGLISSLETGFYQQTLFTCCHHYSGAAAGWMVSLGSPAVSAFPERAIRSTCALSFSRLARRLIALRPAHSCCHQSVTR